MSNLISPSEMQAFNDAIQLDAKGTFFNKPVVWKRAIGTTTNRFGEDSGSSYETINLLGLENANTPRSWPVAVDEESGEIDRESLQMFFIFKDFVDLGKVVNGYPQIDPTRDRFIVDGLVYKPSGDVLGAQSFVTDLIYTIVFSRDKTATGTFR